MDKSALEAMLTQRVVKTRGEVFTKQLNVQDANLTRDAIVASLYEVGCRSVVWRGGGRGAVRRANVGCVCFLLYRE